MGKRRPLRETGPSKSTRMEGADSASSRFQEEDRERKESSDDEEEEEENLLAPQQNSEVVPMTFEFNDMKESYCYGIAKMLEFLLPNHEARSIGEVIANQGEVGTAIVCEEGDDVFAFASIVPLSNMTASPSFTQIFEELCHMVSQLGPGEGQSELQSCLLGANREKTGVYLHGHYVNLPIQLIAPLHTNLKEDVQWLISQSMTTSSSSSSQSFAQIQYLLMIIPCSDDPSQQLKKGTCRNVTGSSSLLLSNFEDDIFHSHSTCTLQVQFTRSSAGCGVILLPLDKVGRCIEEIQQLVPP